MRKYSNQGWQQYQLRGAKIKIIYKFPPSNSKPTWSSFLELPLMIYSPIICLFSSRGTSTQSLVLVAFPLTGAPKSTRFSIVNRWSRHKIHKCIPSTIRLAEGIKYFILSPQKYNKKQTCGKERKTKLIVITCQLKQYYRSKCILF